MLPVEDITLISAKSETKEGVQADAKSKTEYVYDTSENCCDRCCASLLNCCRKTRDCCCFFCRKKSVITPLVTTTTLISGNDPNRTENYEEEHLPIPKEKKDCCTSCVGPFRCWCCRKKKLVDIIKRTNTVSEREAERVIIITIEYNKYSNLDSATNTRLLSTDEQFAYYKDKFKPDAEMKFCLVNSTEVDPTNFELKREEAKTLCRTVMQLKGMRNHYPSDNELDKILDQAIKRTFGDPFTVPRLELQFHPTAKGKPDDQAQ
jgi:hypothetical protein